MDTTDSKPVTYCNDSARLPPALTELCTMPNWVVWRWTKNGSGKWTKPPFQSRFPSRLASNNWIASWSSHAAAVEAVRAREADGVGFVLTGTEVVAIDLDHCRDPATGKIDLWAETILERAPDSYVEITVSGAGLRIIGKGAGEAAHTNYKVEGQDGAKIEIYRRAVRYITVSGVEIGQCAALPNIDALIDDLITQYGEKHAAGGRGNFELDKRGINDLIRNGAPERQRSEVFQSVIFRLANVGLSIADIEETLTEYPDGIARKYAGRLREEIERSYSKWKTSVRVPQANGPGPAHSDGASAHQNAYDWECPDWSIFEDRRGELPDFPRETLPENCQHWAERAAHGAGATLAHVVVPMLGIIASLIGTARRVMASRSWTEPMTLWTAIVGFSGTSKTPGINATKRALAQVERDLKPKIAEQQRAHESRVEAAKAARALWKKEVEKLAEKKVVSLSEYRSRTASER